MKGKGTGLMLTWLTRIRATWCTPHELGLNHPADGEDMFPYMCSPSARWHSYHRWSDEIQMAFQLQLSLFSFAFLFRWLFATAQICPLLPSLFIQKQTQWYSIGDMITAASQLPLPPEVHYILLLLRRMRYKPSQPRRG